MLPNFGLKEHPLLLNSPITRDMPTTRFSLASTAWRYDPRTRKMELVRSSFKHGPYREQILKAMNPPDFTLLGDGSMGVLTKSAYKQGGFSSAAVISVPGGFQITRWLYIEKSSGKQVTGSVRQVQEFVGSDGEYRRTVIKTFLTPPWSAQGANFSFPMFL